MASEKLTKTLLDKASYAAGDRYFWDTSLRGFGAKVNKNDSITFVVQYRLGGRETRTRRFTIGTFGSPFTVDAARQKAKLILADVARGIDPAERKQRERSERVDLNFKTVSDRFVDNYLRTHWPRTWETAAKDVQRVLQPHFKDQPVSTIGRRDIGKLLDEYVNRPARRKNLHSLVRKLCNWFVDEGYLDRSPLAGTRAPKPVRARERCLSPAEVWLLWKTSENLGFPWNHLFRILLLTTQRRAQVAAMDWRQVSGLDQEDARWFCAAGMMKKDVSHLVPLSTLARRELRAVGEAKAGLIFTTTGKTPPSGYSKAKAQWSELAEELAVQHGLVVGTDGMIFREDWRLHDFRRTVTTAMQAAGFQIEVTEANLAHKSGKVSGVAAVYSLYDYAEEKREALESWSSCIEYMERFDNPARLPTTWKALWREVMKLQMIEQQAA